MAKNWLLLVFLAHASLTYWSQGGAWQQDTNWVTSGWVSDDIGWWEDIKDICPWGEDAAATAVQVYDSDGGSQPAIIRMHLNGELQTLFPFIEDVERPIQIEAISSDSSNRLWCAMNQQSHDSSLTSVGGLWVINSDGYMDAGIGEDSLPGWIPIPFGSPYQELFGLDHGPDGNWMVSGMVLDPCCFHREMPTLALLDNSGQWVNSFGENGRLILDVGTSEILDTLGIRPLDNRHEIGGFYSTATAVDGGWFAGGAYSNATHYEVLVTKHTSNGTLDTTFGNNGIVHLNLNPGVNHWAEDIHLDSNGLLIVNVVSHNAGDLPTGWHTLSIDDSGDPLLWETLESDNSLVSHGFLDFPWPLGFAVEEGADSPSLISFDDAIAEASEITPLIPSSFPSGSWAAFRGEFHPIWERLIVSGQWQPPSDGNDSNPQVVFSLWQENSSTSFEKFPNHGEEKFPYPNPITAGKNLFIPNIPAQTESPVTWVLQSPQGMELCRWKHIPGMKTVAIGTDIPAGTYILKAPDSSIRPFHLVIE